MKVRSVTKPDISFLQVLALLSLAKIMPYSPQTSNFANFSQWTLLFSGSSIKHMIIIFGVFPYAFEINLYRMPVQLGTYCSYAVSRWLPHTLLHGLVSDGLPTYCIIGKVHMEFASLSASIVLILSIISLKISITSKSSAFYDGIQSCA